MNKITNSPLIKHFDELTLNELYGILHARQEVFTVEQGIVYQDLDYIDQSSIHLFIPDESKNGIKAYSRIIYPGIKYLLPSIGRVLTIPSQRGKGLGRLIVKKSIEEAKKLFGMPIQIEAQEYLVKFYESFGFESISEPFILEGISHVEMLLK